MCGRYTQTAALKTLQKRFRFDVEENQAELTPRYNIAPTQDLPVVVLEGPDKRRRLRMFRWGLIPSWAKEAKIGNKMINARGESIAEKPAFRGPFRSKRCLVLADGFYEWRQVGDLKQPLRFRVHGGEPFAFAGLWDQWTSPDGKDVRSFTIVTTAANEKIAVLHDRMPAILSPEEEDVWLDPASPLDKVQSVVHPYPSDPVEYYPVTPAVNKPANDVPECIEPLVDD